MTENKVSNRAVRRLLQPGSEDAAQVLERPELLSQVFQSAGAARCGPRDVLIIALLFACGLRVPEICCLRVKDVFTPDGKLKSWFTLRGNAVKSKLPRPIFLEASALRRALIEWRDYRLARNIECRNSSKYRSLRSESMLILRPGPQGWIPFVFQNKEVKRDNGQVSLAQHCGGLENLVRRHLRDAGFPGMASSAGRRSLALWMSRTASCRRVLTLALSGSDYGMLDPNLGEDEREVRVILQQIFRRVEHQPDAEHARYLETLYLVYWLSRGEETLTDLAATTGIPISRVRDLLKNAARYNLQIAFGSSGTASFGSWGFIAPGEVEKKLPEIERALGFV